MTATRRSRTVLRCARGAAVLLLAAYVAQALIPALTDSVGNFFETWVYPSLSVIAGAFCVTRAALRREDRAAWLVLGVGVLASAGGDVWWQAAGYDQRANIPPFTPADALWLAFYPACLVGLCLLARSQVRRLRRGLVLDAAIGALGMTAVGAGLVWGALAKAGITHLGSDFPVDLANLFGDLVLIGVTCAVFTVTGWRPGRSLGLLGTGLLVAAAADAFYLWQGATNFQVGSTAITALTPASLLLVGFAAWARPASGTAVAEEEGWRTVAMSSVFAFAALLVIVMAQREDVAVALAAATLAVAIARMAVALADHMRLLAASRIEALTDALTGLGNRRAMMARLEAEVAAATPEDPRAVMLFDLDGFKQFNDWHGHPAGDALLKRLGSRLSEAIGAYGGAFRLGGDEFCVVAIADERLGERLRAAAVEALSDVDGGFEVMSSCGLVMVPTDAATPTAVLKLADERLYAEKASRRRGGAGQQAASALVKALEEREPQLGQQLDDAATLVRHVAAEVGVGENELEKVVGAARVVRAAKLVRGTHEEGGEIPLGARIVAVCDAFQAMTSDRPYRPALSVREALDELKRCAGTEFDPAVVEAFTTIVVRAHGAASASPLDDLSEWAATVPAPADVVP